MTPAAQRAPEASTRTCVGCRKTAPKEGVVRLVRDPEGRIAVDHPPRLGGRGAWVHASIGCLSKAIERGALARAFEAEVSATADAVAGDLRRRLADRIAGMIAGGRGGARISVGTEAVHEAFDTGLARLLVVAKDAKGDRDALLGKAARAKVPAAAILDKDTLGRALGKDVVGVLAVTDAGLAAALGREISLHDSLDAEATHPTEATR